MTDFVKYQPKTWVSREFIKKNDMNHLETGVENNSEAIESLFNSKIDGWFIENNVLYFTANGEIVGNGGVKIVQNALTPYQFDIQETDLIKYLQGTLINLNNSTATTIGKTAFQGQDKLSDVKLTNINGVDIKPYAFSANVLGLSALSTVEVSAKSIKDHAFSSNSRLTTVDLTYPGTVIIDEYAFFYCSQLTHVIIRSNSIASLAATNVFDTTKIAAGIGGIYVPSALLDDYKSTTNWSTYADHIYPIEEYPKTDFSTITDSWTDIKTHMNAGDYNTRYKVGDTKLLTLNDTYHTQVYMQIAAFDADTVSDDSKAKITWLCKNIYTTHRMNATNITTGGWADTEMRSWLSETVLPYIPSEVSGNIVEVKKSSWDYNTSAEISTVDKLWIPSMQEVNFNNYSNARRETGGVTYTGLFPSATNNTARVKYNFSNVYGASSWWLRSSNSSSNFVDVQNTGAAYNGLASSYTGVVFGFCMS